MVNLKPKDEKVTKIANELYLLLNKKYEVLYDDKKDNPGVKFSRMDLIGIPHHIIIGSKASSENVVEYKNRKTSATELIKISNLSNFIDKLNT